MKRIALSIGLVVALLVGGHALAQDNPEPTPTQEVAVEVEPGEEAPVVVVPELDTDEHGIITVEAFFSELFGILTPVFDLAGRVADSGAEFGFVVTILTAAFKFLLDRQQRFSGRTWQVAAGFLVVGIYWIAQHLGQGMAFVDITAWLNEIVPRIIDLAGALGFSFAIYEGFKWAGVPVFGSPRPDTPPAST